MYTCTISVSQRQQLFLDGSTLTCQYGGLSWDVKSNQQSEQGEDPRLARCSASQLAGRTQSISVSTSTLCSSCDCYGLQDFSGACKRPLDRARKGHITFVIISISIIISIIIIIIITVVLITDLMTITLLCNQKTEVTYIPSRLPFQYHNIITRPGPIDIYRLVKPILAFQCCSHSSYHHHHHLLQTPPFSHTRAPRWSGEAHSRQRSRVTTLPWR